MMMKRLGGLAEGQHPSCSVSPLPKPEEVLWLVACPTRQSFPWHGQFHSAGDCHSCVGWCREVVVPVGTGGHQCSSSSHAFLSCGTMWLHLSQAIPQEPQQPAQPLSLPCLWC